MRDRRRHAGPGTCLHHSASPHSPARVLLRTPRSPSLRFVCNFCGHSLDEAARICIAVSSAVTRNAREIGMTMNAVWVVSLLLATLAMMPAAAHVLEFPNKITLSGIEYLTVQRLYRGWAFTRILALGALLAMVVLLFMVRELPVAFALAWVAF